MQAVRAGIIPAEALDGQLYRTNRLIAQGLIPRQAAEPCSGAWPIVPSTARGAG